MTIYQIDQKSLPDKQSPIEALKGNVKFKLEGINEFPLNKFIPLGYSTRGGKYHILVLFSSLYSDTVSTARTPTKYSGYCSSYFLYSSDFLVGCVISVDPNRTTLEGSYLYVGHDSDQELTNFPVSDDSEGIHVYYTDRVVLILTAEVNDNKFLVLDN